MSLWVNRLSTRARCQLEDVLELCGAGAQAVRIRKESNTTSSASRQARHAQLVRARSTAAVGALLLATHDDAMRELVFSTEFSWLRPYSAEVHLKAPHFAHLVDLANPAPFVRLFEHAVERLLDASPHIRDSETMEALRIQSLCCAMYVGAIFHGEACRSAWQAASERAARAEYFDLPHLRMHLGLIGSWVNECKVHLEWLQDEAAHEHEFADMLCFCRRDTSTQVYEASAALVRGERVPWRSCLFPSRPMSTLRATVQYILACMREPLHMKNEGLILMLLGSMESVKTFLLGIHGDPAQRCDVSPLLAALDRFERVQLMENRRFWTLCDALPESPLKKRLTRLWCASYTNGSLPTTQEGRLRHP